MTTSPVSSSAPVVGPRPRTAPRPTTAEDVAPAVDADGAAQDVGVAEGEQLTASVSVHTVKDHVSSVLEELGADNRVQAAVWAARRGLVAGGS